MHKAGFNKFSNGRLHFESFRIFLGDVLSSGEHSDVKIVCQDKRVLHAHKLILIAGSQLFKELLSSTDKNQSTILFLRGVEYEDMKHVLDFLYLGQTSCERGRMDEFRNLAKDLEINIHTEKVPLVNNKEYIPINESGIIDIAKDDEIKISKVLSSEDMIQKKCDQNTDVDEKEEEKQIVVFDDAQNNESDQNIFRSTKEKKRKKQYWIRKDSKRICIMCKKSFDDLKKIETHCAKEHSIIFKGITKKKDKIERVWIKLNGRFQCVECDKNYTDLTTVKRHFDAKHGKNIVNCDECPFEGKSKHFVRRHKQMVHSQQEYECDKCTHKTKTKSRLRLHINFKHLGITRDCEICGKGFPNETQLKMHIRYTHENVVFECDLCEKNYSKKSDLQRHVKRIHNGTNGLKHECVICNAGYKTKKALDTHIRHLHKPVVRYF